MKHKYNVGDKVVYITLGPDEEGWTLITGVIEECSGDETYLLENWAIDIDGFYLYSPQEAIEFLTNYINKEE